MKSDDSCEALSSRMLMQQFSVFPHPIHRLWEWDPPFVEKDYVE